MEWAFNSYYTLIAATLVLLVGKVLVKKIKFLRDFNIPEPVAGGLIAAIILFALHEVYGVSFKFEKPLQDAFMLIFFTSIGLSADFSRLKAGGLPLVVFTAIVGGFILVQNFVGVGLASALGLDPLIGLITGSVTLTGGHGTAGAWGPDFETKYGLVGATGLGATPTAVANMQSITHTFGASHKAFLIVPMVGAFFVDLINAAILTGFVNFFKG